MSIRRIIIALIVVVVGAGLLGGGFYAGFEQGKKFPEFLIVREVTNIEPESLDAAAADFSIFWQAWQKITEKFLHSDKVGAQEKVYGAIEGLVGSIGDDYAEFFSPEDSEKFEEDIRGSFGGIGAEIGIKKGQLVIVAPLKNTPASEAGLKANDKILMVDDESTDGITVQEAVKIIRGEIGTDVVLTILRDDWEKAKDITITRANIIIPTLDYEIRDDKIVYVALYSFNANSNRLFYDAVLEALGKGSKGLVLDLRNNPGGFLQVAIDMAGWFLPKGTLVVSEVSKESTREFKARGNAALADFPVVILINKGSASASEILAGALKDNRGVKLVGEKTFGKGTVQQIEYLKDGSSLKITTANWVLPSGKILEEEGLTPDFEKEITDEDIENELDPQLDKAIEVIQAEISK